MKIAVELVVRILSELDPKALHVCMRLSKGFNALIKDSPILRYHIALFSRGFVDGASDLPLYPTTFSRQKALLDLEDSWYNFCPRMRTRIEGGNFNVLAKRFDGLWAEYRCHPVDGPRLTLTTLPSIVMGVGLEDSKERTREIKLEDEISDFTIHDHQDLLILADRSTTQNGSLEYTLHLRTLSQNTSHPKANKSSLKLCTLSLPTADDDDEYGERFVYQVFGHMLMVLIVLKYEESLCRSFLRIWNWETGDVLWTHDGEKRIISSFSHVAADLLMLAEHASPLTPDGLAPQLSLWSLQELPNETLKLLNVQTLLLPPIKNGKTYPVHDEEFLTLDDFNILSSPNPIDLATMAPSASPFHFDMMHRVFALVLAVSVHDRRLPENSTTTTFCICIPFKTILKSIYSGPLMDCRPNQNQFNILSKKSTAGPRTIKQLGLAWEDWGRKGACFNHVNAESYNFSVSGMRCSYLEDNGGFTIMDFSPSILQKGATDAQLVTRGDQKYWTVLKRPRTGTLGVGPAIFDIETPGEVLFVRTGCELSDVEGAMVDTEHVLILRGHDVDVWTM
ncbi:hypothetical protein SISNIDRAFT_451334 [Sistotremastrum niveocremeum HHB9708]|uniref:F-box domain-containing protein n=1 Tax=Sistotremastrum niveocremeum HHB9708 TaxID=1314777 RepID=A0A164X861_9AGAM|nr:hypothetical protein SISNIDRAFT_451334 [Sistotremastrum niveocremeum HHB9708]